MIETNSALMKSNRIVVTLDTSARGRAALNAAVMLAAKTSAEIQGVYVEDEDLMRLASLPFSREIDISSACPRELHSLSMERTLRNAADKARRAFAETLKHLNLHGTFRIVRGTITKASLAAAGDVDLLVIGQQGRSPRMVASQYLPRRSKTTRRVVVVFDGSPAAFHLLDLAGKLTDPNGDPLSVLAIGDDSDKVSSQCMTWLRHHGIRAAVDRVLRPSKDAIIEFVRRWPPDVLLINRGSKFLSDVQINRLVNESDCPLILC